MARESRYDSRQFIPTTFGYSEITNRVESQVPFLVSGSKNTIINQTGNIQKRFGLDTQVGDILSGSRFEKFWIYRTLPSGVSDGYTWFLASIFDSATGYYKLYYLLSNTWQAVPDYRGVNYSTRRHEITVSRGLAYVKAFPHSSTGEKLGTIILDGSDGTMQLRPWGLLGPDTPATLSGATTRLDGNLTSGATTITVFDTTGFPSPAGTIRIGYEIITYTGTTATTFTGCTRGASGTTAEAHDDNTVVLYFDWAASDHKVDVTRGWYYSYAYKTITGQLSNRADLQRNPDLMPSFTGPFKDLVPKLVVQGQADTTNIPTIVIFRSTDGGGTFGILEEIVNTGAGDITYYDDSFGTGATSTTFNDPVPDTSLNFGAVAPSLTSNSPPPAVIPPLVTGEDTPEDECYAMTTHVGRIFYSIKNYLLFSSREELRDGIGEECFPSGTLGGNYFIFNDLITGLVSDNDSLYIFTERNIYRMSGYTKDSFSFVKLYDIGAAINVNNVAAYNGQVAFMGTDGNIYLIQNGNIRNISKKIVNNMRNFLTQRGSVYFLNSRGYELLFVCLHQKDLNDVNTSSYIWVYDLSRSRELDDDFWWSPWEVNSSAVLINNNPETSGLSKSVYSAVYTSAGSTYGVVTSGVFSSPSVVPSSTDVSLDSGGGAINQNFSAEMYLSPLRIPPGNHVNLMNLPTRDTKFTRLFLFYPADTTTQENVSPQIRLDNRQTALTNYAANKPPRIKYDTDTAAPYAIKVYSYTKDCYRVDIRLIQSDNTKSFELYGLIAEFMSNYGPTK